MSLVGTQGPPGLPSLLSHAKLVAIEDGRAVIRYGAQHETFVRLLDRNGKKDQVRDAISQVLNRNVGIEFEIAPDAAPVIAEANPSTAEGSPESDVNPRMPRHRAIGTGGSRGSATGRAARQQ